MPAPHAEIGESFKEILMRLKSGGALRVVMWSGNMEEGDGGDLDQDCEWH